LFHSTSECSFRNPEAVIVNPDHAPPRRKITSYNTSAIRSNSRFS
jgi:hypothetical protein